MKAVALFFSFLLGCVALMAWAGGGRQQAVSGNIIVRLQPTMPTSPQTGNANLSGNITAGEFQGDGSQLTNLDAGNVGLGVVSPAHGGTGIDTSSISAGEILYADGAGTWTTLPQGADSQVLTVAGGLPTWATPTGGVTLPYAGSANVTSPNAVFKLANTTTTNGTTLWCENSGTNGIGVYSNNSATSGFAYAGQFLCASPDGRAVFASNSATTGAGLGGRFGSASNAGTAVYATASAPTGTTYGGVFESASSGGVALYGHATNLSGGTVAVQAVSDSNLTAFGVYALATSSSATVSYGVFGQTNTPSQYGVWANGKSGASGTKSFRIDYPNDPENKYLMHYSAESPEVLNIYRGTVTLDGSGKAIVLLPSYFAMINKSPSYQLTAVGAGMPSLHVEVEISESALSRGAMVEPGQSAPSCSFTIAGGVAGKKVSWEVKAVRNDRWVQKNGAPVQTDKQGLERGTYQHPDLYNQPPERGMTYDITHRVPAASSQDSNKTEGQNYSRR